MWGMGTGLRRCDKDREAAFYGSADFEARNIAEPIIPQAGLTVSEFNSLL
jgi:hypothetical protein